MSTSSIEIAALIASRVRAKDPLTITDVQAAAPPRSLVRQIGVRLLPWNPPPCNGRHSCLFAGFLRSPFSPSTPRPLPLAAGAAAAVQLNFELGRCADVPLASPATPREVDVSYRWGSGPLQHQRLALGSAQLRLRMPRQRDCLPGPHSRIALTGPFGISSDWTVPGSSGDTCARTSDRGLSFVSRLYQVTTDAPAVRVRIRLARFRGVGFYRTLTRPAAALGPAQVLVTTGVGVHGWTTVRAKTSVVRVTRVTRTTVEGRMRADLVAPGGRAFLVHGIWRCTTR